MRKLLVCLLLIGGGYFFAPVEGTFTGDPIPTIGAAQARNGMSSRGKGRRHHRSLRRTTVKR
jgi:hypothetical protein